MSDTSQGPGWWLASDGKWYPPELWTGPPSTRPASTRPGGAPAQPQPTYPLQGPAPGAGPTTPPPIGATPGYGAAPGYGATPGYGAALGNGGAPTYGATPYGSYGATPYMQPGAGLPYGAQSQKTNGMAIAALVCGIAGFFFFTAILGVVFGFVARSQIKRANGMLKGGGMALAGIIVGFGWLALLVLSVAFNHSNNTNGGVVGPALLMGHLGCGLFI
jgi:Domain of unknown function (DUF4190)